MDSRSADRRMTLAAATTAAALIAQQVGGRAVRDALFLSAFPVTTLPMIVFVTAIFSVAASVLAARLLTRHGPHRVIPAAFFASALILVSLAMLSPAARRGQAIALYLEVSAIGMILISGFWSLVNESFDPRSAKRQISRIAAAGTLGGLAGGLLIERVGSLWGVHATLPLLASLHGICALTSLRLRPLWRRTPVRRSPSVGASSERNHEDGAGLRIFGQVPYLRTLAALVLLSTVAAALIDYVFKLQVTRHLSEAALLRLFAVFYTGISLLTFLAQVTASRRVLERFGLGRTVASLPLGVAVGSLASLIVPGPVSAAITRALESVLRNSLYRSGYEVLFSPVPTREKRATKAVVDVGVERVGDALGAGIIQLVLLPPGNITVPLLLGLAAACSLAGLAIARRVQSGYVEALERNLWSRSSELGENDLATTRTLSSTIERAVWAEDSTADFLQEPRAAFLEAMLESRVGSPSSREESVADADLARQSDPFFRRVVELRSRDADRVRRSILELGAIDAVIAPHLIPLLAWDAVAETAGDALRDAAPRIAGQLVDALVDAEQEFAIRRRIPRILSECASPLAVEGLMQGLLDRRFEVRFRSGRALLHLHEALGIVTVDAERIYLQVLREVAVDRSVWESQRLLDLPEDHEESRFVDALLRDRANRCLEHVFNMLALALPGQPLQIAFRGLHAEDPGLRGTALEYLESVLPPRVRDGLWPILEDHRAPAHPARSREAVLADLLRSNESIAINLRALRGGDAGR